MEDYGDGDSGDAGMPHDVGDEVENDGDFVRVEGSIEHPTDAKGIRDKSSPVDFLLFEDQGNVLTQDYFHLFALFFWSGEHAWLTFWCCPWLEVISTGFCGCKRAKGFPDTTCKSSTEHTQEGRGDRTGGDEDDTQDLSAGDSERCGPFILGPKMIGEDICDDEEGGLKHEGEHLDDESENPGDIAMKGAGWSVPTLTEGDSVQIHDRMSFEGSLGKNREDGNEERSCEAAENDRCYCGGS